MPKPPSQQPAISKRIFGEVSMPKKTTSGQQVIMQVWISTHFGVISERPPTANEEISFIHPTITPLHHFCKTISSSFYSLLPSSPQPHDDGVLQKAIPKRGAD